MTPPNEVVGTLFEDTVERRLLCGEGSFDLRGLVAVLRDKGFDGPWGVEILSSSFRQLPVQPGGQAGRRLRAGGALVAADCAAPYATRRATV